LLETRRPCTTPDSRFAAPEMTEDDLTGHSSAGSTDRTAAVLAPPQRRRRSGRRLFRRQKRYNRRIRWLRLLALLVPTCFLALISLVFGMVLAVEPQIGPLVKSLKLTYTNGANSILYSAPPDVRPIATLTDHNQFFLAPKDLPLDSLIAHAVIAVEDKRFYSEPAIDYRGVARALVADAFGGGGTQGGSTITEQFVKTALGKGDPQDRTVVEKVKEAFTAFQLTHLWSKQQILTEYLNTTFFGVATGIEAAAQAWFGNDPTSTLYHCGSKPDTDNPQSLCVTDLTADQAALLAGIIDSPTTYVELLSSNPQAVADRRNRVLEDMWQQGYLTEPEYLADIQASLPSPQYVLSPSEENSGRYTGYFTSWVASQLTANPAFKNLVFGGGLRVYTTLDLELEQDAQQAVEHYLPPFSGPSAALVAINNDTGEVKAMFGGYDFGTHAFNLATQAERQPGSSWKAFDLAAALEAGFTRNTMVESGLYTFPAPAPYYPFTFHNDEHSYYDTEIPLWEATAVSDNTVFARLSLDRHYLGNAGPESGPDVIANIAKKFGISTGISINPSMVIGGLTQGVTPLDMAHAYETIAAGGELVTGSLASDSCAGGPRLITQRNAPAPGSPGCPGPVGIRFVAQDTDKSTRSWHNHTSRTRVPGYSYADSQKEISLLKEPLTSIGTAAGAAIPGVKAWGKTGTTSRYTDAWFVGSTPALHTADGTVPSMTVAVWVGYATSNRSMAHGYGGKPVYGGTYPALIWHNYIVAAIHTIEQENVHHSQHLAASKHGTNVTGASGSTSTGASANTGSSAPNTGASQTGGTTVAPKLGTTAPNTTVPPSTGTTSAGGTPPPTGTTTPPATTTPVTPPPTTTPPPTSTGGGITAPGGGAVGPTT
jgi:penicillin-binding protein 1A